MADAAKSQKLAARARPRLLGGATTVDEARENLQARLNVYSKVMFWSFVALLVFLSATYRLTEIAPRNTDVVFEGSAVLLAVMAFIWRAVLYRKTLSARSLYRIDLLFATTIGCAFGASAALQAELHAAAYTSLIFGAYTVFTRALFVPSSARRTAIVSTVTFIPIIALGGVYLGLTTKQDLPPAAFIIGGTTLCVIAIVIAANGSAIIYGLRKKVDEAMHALRLGAYSLDCKIGEGGMGSVWRAHHVLLRRPTAIKLLPPDRNRAEDLDRFESEVQHMSKLTHPNTVAVFDYGHNADGVFYYAMEYLDGINLDQLVKTSGPQPAGRVIHILTQVCGALQEAHDAGLIHRDIKPANIILCQRGGVPDVAKVVDYGLVKEITRDAGASAQVILGTPAYIAPEAVTDPEHITRAVDIYALGCVAYYLLTGRPVFAGKSQIEVCIQHVTDAPRPMRDEASSAISAELEATVMKCLAKKPEDRFPSAQALAQALQPRDGVPAQDWSTEDAAMWWRDFRSAAVAPSVDAETMTITIDLEKRFADPLA